MHSVLVTPLGLAVPGNGLSQRCRLWADALAALGEVTQVQVPVVGPVDEDEGILSVLRSPERSPLVPALAQGITFDLGLTVGNHIHVQIATVDLVVGIRSYMGDICLGVQAATGARLIVDLDDDDVKFFEAAGELDEAARFHALIERLALRADVLTSAHGFTGTELVPNGVDLSESPRFQREIRQSPHILFLGNMGYRPNREAAEWIIEDIAPAITQLLPEAQIAIAGPGSEELSNLGVGYVEDLRALMADTDVVIAPLREGSGTRIKILDAWAHGVPIVSTRIGAEGLDAVDGQNIILADDPQSIAQAIMRIVNEPELADQLMNEGRKTVHDKYSRQRSLKTVQSLAQRIVGGRATDDVDVVVATVSDSLHLVETEEGLIVLDTTSGDVHELDATASVIFSLIDGLSSDLKIANEIKAIYQLDDSPISEVSTTISNLISLRVASRVRLHRDRLSA